jgi:hypothetical protein
LRLQFKNRRNETKVNTVRKSILNMVKWTWNKYVKDLEDGHSIPYLLA